MPNFKKLFKSHCEISVILEKSLGVAVGCCCPVYDSWTCLLTLAYAWNLVHCIKNLSVLYQCVPKTTKTITTHANIMIFNLFLNLFFETKFKSNLISLYSSHNLYESEFPYTTHVFDIILLSTHPGMNQNTAARLGTQNFVYVCIVSRANQICLTG